ncbi:hypothetical protein [Legionella parisiensis]|uniref:hypothetical protein n=1 Tax=Legionella parisiensis TaxID=45071 RepID=UPI001ED98C6D|nr:hypothetical protein [Legionella parisiensis]
MMKNFLMFLGFLFSFSVFAADIPEDTLGAQKYDRTQCLHNTTQDCINSQCLTSSEIDCQDNCRSMAQAKCQQQINE